MGDFRSIIFNFHTFKDFLDTLLLLLSNLFPIMLEKISSVRFQVFFFFEIYQSLFIVLAWHVLFLEGFMGTGKECIFCSCWI